MNAINGRRGMARLNGPSAGQRSSSPTGTSASNGGYPWVDGDWLYAADLNAGLEGTVPFKAAGSTTARAPVNRADDTINAIDYGVLLDGTTDNTANLNLARAAAGHNGSVFLPAGRIHSPITTTSGPTTAVRWLLDGTTFPDGLTPVTQIGAPGDLVDGYFNGYRYFGKQANPVGATAPVLRLDLLQNLIGTASGGIAYGLNVNATQNAGDESLVYALAVLGTSYADVNSLGLAGIQSTVIKQGGGHVWAIQTVVRDETGLASSANGHGMHSAELAIRSTNVDDAINSGAFGGVGIRKAIHISLTCTVGAADVETGFSHAIWISGDPTGTKSYISSVFGVDLFVDTYQVFDARGAQAPFNYGSNPVAALRMAAGQVVDFNGGPALNSVAGAYLQYRTATARLYYVVAGVDRWSVDGSGNMRCSGTVTGSTTP